MKIGSHLIKKILPGTFKKYVDSFFCGKEPLASSNGLKWNSQFADSVRFTNASL